MFDQAEALRRKMEQRKLKETTSTKVVAVLSGKGGVGKSVFSLNFALGLNQQNKKTLIIDLDIGMGNIDILLGLHCQYNIVDMIEKQLSIEDVIAYHDSGLAVLTGGSGLTQLFHLDKDKFNFFLDQLNKLRNHFDVIIFDLGAGMNEDILNFVKAVHEILLVTTTEPTALTDAYAAIKIASLYANDIPIRVIVNRYDDEQEVGETWTKLSNVTKRFLGRELSFLGSLPRDTSVVKAVKSQQPFIISSPRSKVSIHLNRIVSTYLNEGNDQNKPTMESFITKLKRLFR